MFFLNQSQQMPQKLHDLCLILQEASQMLAQQYQHYLAGSTFQIDRKTDHSPVTEADLLIHDFLVKKLTALRPARQILSEEADTAVPFDCNEYWLIDPLDGTKEFINKTGEFTINLSLIVDGQSVISALAVPLQHCIYISEQGQVPFKWDFSQTDIRIFQYAEPKYKSKRPLVMAFSRHYQRYDEAQRYQAILAELQRKKINYELYFAGSAYKFCLMLEGQIDLYPRMHPTQEWDTAAGQGLLQSIGGEVFDLKQRPFLYNQRSTFKNGGFVAVRQRADWAILAEVFK